MYRAGAVLFLTLLTSPWLNAQTFDVHTPPIGYVHPVEGSQSIVGTLIHQAANGDKQALAKQNVLLDIVFEGKTVATAFANTEDDGSFRFERLNGKHGLKFRIRCIFNNAVFRSDLLPLGPRKQRKIDLTVFDHSSATDNLTIELSHIRVFAEEGRHIVDLEQSFMISNSSSMAFFRSDGLRITLPKRYMDPTIPQNEFYFIEEGVIVAPHALTPKQQMQIVVTYSIPRTMNRLRIIQALPTELNKLAVLLYPQSMHINGNLESLGEKNLSGVDYKLYITPKEATVGRTINITVKKLPGGFGVFQWLLLLVMALIIVFAWMLLRPGKKERNDYNELLMKLKSLENAHTDGKIDNETYQKHQQQLQKQLLTLKKEQQ